MDKLGMETDRLCQLYPEKSEDIAAKVDEARGWWEALKLIAEQRMWGVDQSYNRLEWTNGIQALILSLELAKDIAGAVTLLEQHQEHKCEIEARTDSFKQTAETGQRLLDEDIDEADEIRQCLQNLAMEQTSLNNLWEKRRILYEQCMDLQLFYRDTEQAESWMTKQEAFLQNDDLGDSLDAVESLLKKHEDFKKSSAAQEEKIQALDEFGTKLIEGGHYAAEDVAKRREMVLFQLLARRRHLMDRMAQRRERLKESYRLHSFDRDCDQMLGWIQEKLKTAKDQSYLDPTNIRGKLQKHGNFEQELRANRNRLDEIKATGQELIQSGQYANEYIQKNENLLREGLGRGLRLFQLFLFVGLLLSIGICTAADEFEEHRTCFLLIRHKRQTLLEVADHEVGHVLICERDAYCFPLVNVTIVPVGSRLGCAVHRIPKKLSNDQLLAMVKLKFGGGARGEIIYGVARGMGSDSPAARNYAYTYIINQRLKQPKIEVIPFPSADQIHPADLNATNVLLQNLYIEVKTELSKCRMRWKGMRLRNRLIIKQTMTGTEVTAVIGNIRKPKG
ncbi:hypothetical protein niasHT_018112 [Heterodera trifolii]|uniref:Uncharacterized protein n=1 Tax=Heterodera trifolii TaxID=157864 RepID=A0ABD2LDE4_9BILA